MSFKEDYEFGLTSEERNLKIFSDFFNTILKKDDDKFSLFDFHNEENSVFVELKTRRIAHNTYNTVMIGANKVEYAKRKIHASKEEGTPIPSFNFCFNFTTGTYYLPYVEEEFDLFERKKFRRNNRNDFYDDDSDVIFIPSSSLKLLMKK
jgi:hypothetical protein